MFLNVKSAMNQNSMIEIGNLFDFVKKKGMSHAFVTDDGTIHNLFEVSEAAQRTGIQPGIGVRFPFRIGANVVHLALYPRNNKAKGMLNTLTTKFHKNQKRNLGLEGMKSILTEMAIVIDSKDMSAKAVKEVIKTLVTFLEKNVLFVGLHETFEQDNKEKNLEIKKVLEEEKIKYLPFNEIMFLKEEEEETFASLVTIKELEVKEEINHIFPTKEDIESMFDYMEDMVDSTMELVAQVKADYLIKKEKIQMPSFPVPAEFVPSEKFQTRFKDYIASATQENIRSAGYLWHLVFQGLVERYGINEVAINRAIKELEVIVKMNFSDYFLIVWDFIDYARKNGIVTGPGRGSVAGSIVSYCLNITQVCPLTYNLQFERFLSEFRKGMPDIDVDVSQKHRRKLIKYLRNKYGREYVSHILTRANYGFKVIITNLLKKMRVPNERVEEMMKLAPENYDSIQELLENKPEAKELLEKSKDVRFLLERGYALKGVPSTTSTHAAGIIISGVSLEQGGLPMMYDSEGELITQIQNDTEKNSLEKMGYLKFDILGLRNLDVIDMIKKLIELKTGKPFGKVPLNDTKTLALLNEAVYMDGVFQMESKSAKNVIQQIGIEKFEDIVIVNAFNRPGPLDFVHMYAQRKGQPVRIFDENGKQLPMVEELYPILEESRGIIIFQEQINELVCKWAGYTLEEADIFRRAISKKDEESLKSEGKNFIERSVEKGRDENTTREIFKIILRFANYGFNKSHAVVYSIISYELAYFKANYPLEFWASLLTSVGNNSKKVAKYITEARKMGVEILPPDINVSTDEFQVESNAVRCAFQMVDSIGAKTARGIVEARKEVSFKHIYDITQRIKVAENVGDADIEALAKVGALDSIGERHEILSHLNSKEGNSPLTIGEKSIMELEGCNVVFSIPSVDREKMEKAVNLNDNYISAVVKSVEIKIDKFKREMARIELVSLKVKGEYFSPVIFSSLWKEVKEDIVVGSVVLAEVANGKKGSITKITTLQL